MTPLRAAVDPFVFWALAIGFWLFGRVRDGLKRQSGGTAAPPRRVPPATADARAADDARRGTQTTQQEAEELERWLREKIGMPLPKREMPPIVKAPAPAPKRVPPSGKPRSPIPTPAPKRSQTGPLGRTAKTPLESHPDIEERESTSWNTEREVVDYDDQFPDRAAPVILDLDRESAFAAERRKQQAERRNAAHTDEDHDAFHRRISSPELHESEQKARRARRLAALRASWITTEILGPPVSERRTS